MNHLNKHRQGFTLVELLVVIAIIGVLVGLLLPAVQAAREAARRMSCSNNFKQIGLGIHNYHSAFKQLPTNGGGTARALDNANVTNRGTRLFSSWLVAITPFVEQQSLWEQIANPSQDTVTPGYAINVAPSLPAATWPAMGPCPWVEQYVPWMTQVPTYRCPSDPNYSPPGTGRTNYAAAIGDAMDQVHFGGKNELGFVSNQNNPTVAASMQNLNWMATRSRAACRGFFWQRTESKFRDVLDGLANTIAAGEQCTSGQQREVNSDWVRGITGTDANPSLCKSGLHIDPERPQFYARTASISANNTEMQGLRWADYRPKYSAITTVLPPNSASCTNGNNDNSEGWHTVGSRHQGGAHVLMGDGAVIFMTDSVDTGDLTLPPVERGNNNLGWMGAGTDPGSKSPYGLWGALGTRGMKETVEEQLNQ